MTLDEAIKHAEEVAEDAKLISMKIPTDYGAEAAKKCANEHRQLAEWLKELKECRQHTGHWEVDGHHIVCSRCGMAMCDTDREGDRIPNDFCPNCGARMKGAEDEA